MRVRHSSAISDVVSGDASTADVPEDADAAGAAHAAATARTTRTARTARPARSAPMTQMAQMAQASWRSCGAAGPTSRRGTYLTENAVATKKTPGYRSGVEIQQSNVRPCGISRIHHLLPLPPCGIANSYRSELAVAPCGAAGPAAPHPLRPTNATCRPLCCPAR